MRASTQDYTVDHLVQAKNFSPHTPPDFLYIHLIRARMNQIHHLCAIVKLRWERIYKSLKRVY